jgi:hypothetical protein
MTKKNLDGQLRTLTGTGYERDGKPVQIRTIIAEALASQVTEEDVQKKLLYGKLAFKLSDGQGEMDFTPEDLVAMKTAVGKSCGPLLVVQIYEILDE